MTKEDFLGCEDDRLEADLNEPFRFSSVLVLHLEKKMFRKVVIAAN